MQLVPAVWATSFTAVTLSLVALRVDTRDSIAERVTKLTRDSAWTLVSSVPVKFMTRLGRGRRLGARRARRLRRRHH